MPLSPEEIAAAQGMFTPAQPAMSSQPQPQQAAPDMYAQAAEAFGPPLPPAPVPTNAPSYLLNDETVAAAQGAFRPPMAAPPAPAAPAAAPRAPAGPNYGAKVREDQKLVLGSYDKLADAKRAEGAATVEKGQGLAQRYDEEAAHIDNMARIQHDEALQTQNLHAKYLADTDAMIHQVASEKIDPNHFFHTGNSGRDFTVALGALLMGAAGAMASRDGRNVGLEALNTMIARDIDAQEKNIAGKRSAIAQRQSLYGQMRESLGDKMLADQQFKMAALESAKNRLLAFSAGSDSKIDAARTSAAVGSIEQEQAQTRMQYDARAQQMAAAAAAATATAAQAKAQRDFDNIIKVRELGIKEQDANTRTDESKIKAQEAATKAREAAGGGKEHATKLADINTSVRETNTQMDALTKHPALDKIGVTLPYAAKAGQRLAPDASAAVQEVNEINTRILQTIGKYAKDADGKPNKDMIERLESRFEIHPDDTKEIAVAKIRGVQRAVNALAAQEGATEGIDPDAATHLGFKASK